MVDVVSIVLAAVSLIGSLVAAAFTGWITWFIDEVRRRADAKKLVAKYHDPLLLAALDLQSRLFNITQQGLLNQVDGEEKKDLIYVYTSFLFGQFLSWTYILRREAQFLRFSTQKNNRQMARILEAITHTLYTDENPGEGSFMLWKGQQMAIGEVMTRGNDQMYCIGYSTFSTEYKTKPEFRQWFIPIEQGIQDLVHAGKHRNRVPTYRLRRLQHLLIDLILTLDENGQGEGRTRRGYVDAASGCECNGCLSNRSRPRRQETERQMTAG
ncbi:hypothetical protein BKA65DRAFT_520155 [Rhexocercosporidium sp. MPI-PUGE-AT-0058]|nr:hypothetical protein BKA65DRAFT_520155 [Rhexocercosporidium sp. MPI-PUGE-AT-0058]